MLAPLQLSAFKNTPRTGRTPSTTARGVAQTPSLVPGGSASDAEQNIENVPVAELPVACTVARALQFDEVVRVAEAHQPAPPVAAPPRVAAPSEVCSQRVADTAA